MMPLPEGQGARDEDDKEEEEEEKDEGKEDKEAEESEEEKDQEQEDAGHEENEDVKVPRSPYTPTKAEKDRHDATHAQYRSWCPHCAKGRGKESPHRSHARSSNPTVVPELVMDYCFRSQEGEATITVLGLRSRATGATIGLVVPAKGRDDWVIKRIVTDEFGHNKILMRTDSERPITALKKAVKIARALETITDEETGQVEYRMPGETLLERRDTASPMGPLSV